MKQQQPLQIVVLGLSITSSWGNGHATTFRGLVRELANRGHQVLFLERDVPWYAAHRDLPRPGYCQLGLYASFGDLQATYTEQVREADLVLLGSYVPEGVAIGQWVLQTAQGLKAFYDIDTPLTLAKLRRQDYEYLHPRLIPQFDLYLSFSGGPTLQVLEQQHGSPCARPLYCSFDPELYYPESQPRQWDLGYLGTYSPDRQPPLEKLFLEPARQWPQGRFVVAGPQYPASVRWPANTRYIPHLPPAEHRRFYNSQRFTQNITRADMVLAGYSPSVRLFEAAACGTPIISDYWPGLDSFFTFGTEILVAYSTRDTLDLLQQTPEAERQAIGERARLKVCARHTAAHRARELEGYVQELRGNLKPASK